MDFSVPYMFYTEDMLLKKTSAKESIDLLQFMNPFDPQVWFATLATLIVISVAVFIINYFSPYGYKGENGKGTSEEFTFFNSVWFSLACMLQQGGDNTPRSLSGRDERISFFLRPGETPYFTRVEPNSTNYCKLMWQEQIQNFS